MSGDELMVLLASLALGWWTWSGWYLPPVTVERLGAPSPGRRLLLATPVACAAVLFAVLKTVSARDVRDDPLYLGFYMVVGAAWVGVGAKLLPYLGLSPRDDGVERGNGAATVAAGGALLAITLCFAGGNVGDGPGWWVVLFAAGIATAALGGLWLLLEWVTGISDAVTVDRDYSSAARLAGLLVAAGLIFGRAAAGNWVSAGATIGDFVDVGWPAAALFAVAMPVERLAAPTPARPAPSTLTFGVLPAAAYLAAAALYVARLAPAW